MKYYQKKLTVNLLGEFAWNKLKLLNRSGDTIPINCFSCIGNSFSEVNHRCPGLITVITYKWVHFISDKAAQKRVVNIADFRFQASFAAFSVTVKWLNAE